MVRSFVRTAATILVAALLTACGGNTQPTPAPTSPPHTTETELAKYGYHVAEKVGSVTIFTACPSPCSMGYKNYATYSKPTVLVDNERIVQLVGPILLTTKRVKYSVYVASTTPEGFDFLHMPPGDQQRLLRNVVQAAYNEVGPAPRLPNVIYVQGFGSVVAGPGPTT